LHASGLCPATVTNVPRSNAVRRYEPSAFLWTVYVRFAVSFAQTLPLHVPLSGDVIVVVYLNPW
jgi:hypothetical protein